MACGPYVHAERSLPVQGKVDELWLTNITYDDARELFPLRRNDPTLDYLLPFQHELFTTSDAADIFMERIVGNPNNVTWGIMGNEHEPLLGFAALTLLDSRQSPGYTIILRESAQGRGVGTLATAAVVAAAGQEGMLSAANRRYPLQTTELVTLIHPENGASQRMCSRIGFDLEGKELVAGMDEHVLAYRLRLGRLRRVALNSSIILADTQDDRYQITTYV